MSDGHGSNGPGRHVPAPPALSRDSGAPRFDAARLTGADGPELVSELAHTLRSSAASILILVESLHTAAMAGGDGARRDALALLYGSALKLSTFTSNLMELVRGGGELVGVEPEPVVLADHLAAVADAIRPIAEHRGVAVRVGPTDSEPRLGHPMALNRLLLGLAVAALEFTDARSIGLAARGRAASPTVDFSIAAPGAELHPDSLALLDQPVGPREGHRGWHWSMSGTAVATARRLLDRMGGELRIEAGVGTGLRFRFSIELPPLRTG